MRNMFFVLIAGIFFLGCKKDKNGTTNSEPISPADLTATVISTTQVNLSWTDKSTNETGFKIQRKTGTGNFADVGTVGKDVVNFSDEGLNSSTTYSYRVYAYNGTGASSTYTNVVTVTTFGIATLTTTAITNINITSAKSGGIISTDGGNPITSRGVVWSTTTNPTVTLTTKTTDGTGTGTFTSNITGLTANTKYYVRAYSTNSAGTAYGNEVSFTTLPQPVLPTLTTTTLSSINETTAVSGGNITSDGGDVITSRGVVWSTTTNPTVNLTTKTTDGIGTGIFTSNITGLTANTKYYVRAYATNSIGTAYGDELSFTSAPIQTSVTDIVGNTYPIVKIGSQIWMAENLRTTKYNDGTSIPVVNDNTQWASNFNNNAKVIMMTWYNNDPSTFINNKFGALYNWFAINPADNGNKKVCPTGWHVPTDAEWTLLTDFLGGESVAGGKLKTTSVWPSPNTAASNSSGFNGLPGGYRNIQGGFDGVGFGFWWSSTEFNGGNAWNRGLSSSNGLVDRSLGIKSTGLSVRCIRD